MYLQKIKFDDDSPNFAGEYGWAEKKSVDSKPIRIYDVAGLQLDFNGLPLCSYNFVAGGDEFKNGAEFLSIIARG